MEKSYGDKESKIWMIADSPPKKWQCKLSHPLDPKHPAVHNIWTPVFDRINEELFTNGFRLKRESLYIINAVTDSEYWGEKNDLKVEIDKLKSKINKHKPTGIITFGSRAYDAVSKAKTAENLCGKLKDWTSEELGKKFVESINGFDKNEINIFPLLHASVSRRNFLEAQADYCNVCRCEYINNADYNYFAYVGSRIAEIIYNHKDCFINHLNINSL